MYLYYPYFEQFGRSSSRRFLALVMANGFLASLGCFVLSRRWIATLAGSLFAGAMYGFGPYMLGLGEFHPAAGFLAAMVPWLFCPAAFGPKGKLGWLRAVFAVFPFLVILFLSLLLTYLRLFVIPIDAKLSLANLDYLATPLVMAERGITLIGFYHLPIATLVMGFAMLLSARRFGVMIILGLGVVLTSLSPFPEVSPVIWLAIPSLCCSILIGEGVAALLLAGFADRKWLLLTAVIMAALSILALSKYIYCEDIAAGLGAKYAMLFAEAAKMYVLGTVIVVTLFLAARAKIYAGWLRLVVLGGGMVIDMVWGARFIVDKIF